MNLLFCTYVNGQFDDYSICEGMGLFVDTTMPVLSLIANKYLEYSLLCLVSLFIVNLVKSLSSPLVPMNQRLLTFILRPKWNGISVVFYNFLALSLLKLSVAWRIANPLLISYSLIQSLPRVKHIEVPISYIHEQFYLHKTILDNISTYIQPSYMGTKPLSGPLLERNLSYIRDVRFYPLINMIIFLSLISIFTPCLGPRSQTLVVHTTLS